MLELSPFQIPEEIFRVGSGSFGRHGKQVKTVLQQRHAVFAHRCCAYGSLIWAQDMARCEIPIYPIQPRGGVCVCLKVMWGGFVPAYVLASFTFLVLGFPKGPVLCRHDRFSPKPEAPSCPLRFNRAGVEAGQKRSDSPPVHSDGSSCNVGPPLMYGRWVFLLGPSPLPRVLGGV